MGRIKVRDSAVGKLNQGRKRKRWGGGGGGGGGGKGGGGGAAGQKSVGFEIAERIYTD